MSLPLHPEFTSQSKNRRYLLAISGGRDSVALLHALLDAGYKNLVLCHLNHGLRGKASGQDAAFVRRLAKKHALSCEIDSVNVRRIIAQSDQSMELAARNARHTFFTDSARTYRCSRVLLAHHADDQAETILFNLLRGSGGLKGMSFSTEHEIGGKKLTLIRPLLETSRTEIDYYLDTHRISYREDASNAEPIATRNRIRNEVIPLLTKIMGRQIRPALLRAADISKSKDQALQKTLDTLKLEDPQGRLFLPTIIQLSPALQLMALQRYLKRNRVPNISHDLLLRCQALLDPTHPAKVNLPGGRFFRRKEKRLFISYA